MLAPQLLWRHFKNIMAIPHTSLHEHALKGYARTVAERCGAIVEEDEVGNLIIRKRASEGMCDRKGVILQAHLDMVAQCNSDMGFDFLNNPIEGYIDGEWVRANGMTLGADNGIGVAAALSVLEDQEAQHGDLELLLTVNEEMGMDGAFGLKEGELSGDILLNLDTEVEGELCIGCAGGLSLTATFEHERVAAPRTGYVARRLSVSGLRGGHSGIQINEQRANANKLLFRLLRVTKLDVMLVDVSGGTLSNAIPREAYADLLINEEDITLFEAQMLRHARLIEIEYESVESNMSVEISEIEYPDTIIEESAASCIVWAIAAAHDGVYRYSHTMAGVVDTSSNLAIVRSSENETKVELLLRSFSESSKSALADTLASTFELADAEVSCTEGYPGWVPSYSSQILEVVSRVYRELFNSEASVKAVHAGLECGIIGDTYHDMDMISFGPTIVSPHSPDEMVNIESVERFYRLLLEVLRNTPKRN